jgi:hypothetical protein
VEVGSSCSRGRKQRGCVHLGRGQEHCVHWGSDDFFPDTTADDSLSGLLCDLANCDKCVYDGGTRLFSLLFGSQSVSGRRRADVPSVCVCSVHGRNIYFLLWQRCGELGVSDGRGDVGYCWQRRRDNIHHHLGSCFDQGKPRRKCDGDHVAAGEHCGDGSDDVCAAARVQIWSWHCNRNSGAPRIFHTLHVVLALNVNPTRKRDGAVVVTVATYAPSAVTWTFSAVTASSDSVASSCLVALADQGSTTLTVTVTLSTAPGCGGVNVTTTGPAIDTGLSPGAIAGIVIGCLVAGALVAIGVILLSRHRTKRREVEMRRGVSERHVARSDTVAVLL